MQDTPGFYESLRDVLDALKKRRRAGRGGGCVPHGCTGGFGSIQVCVDVV